jgi:hypothetical protein
VPRRGRPRPHQSAADLDEIARPGLDAAAGEARTFRLTSPPNRCTNLTAPVRGAFTPRARATHAADLRCAVLVMWDSETGQIFNLILVT